MPTANELYQQAKVAGNVSFQAEWGRTQQQLAKLSAGERVSQLGFSSLEPGEYVMAYDALGQARMRIGHQSDGTVGVIYGNGTPPPAPSAPSVGARQLGVFVGWDGTFAAGYAKPGDFARVDVHMSEEQGFLPNGETIVGTIAAEGGILVGADSVTHYIKLVAVTSSDVASAPTAEVVVLPLPAGQIAAGAIGAQQLAVDVAMISRVIVGSPTASRLELDGRIGAIPGMRLFDNNGQQTFMLDATTGSVAIKGAIRSADTGERMVMREGGANEWRFYPNTGDNYARLFARTFSESGVDYGGLLMNGAIYSNNRRSYFWLTGTSLQMYRGLSTDGSVSFPGVYVNDNSVVVTYRTTSSPGLDQDTYQGQVFVDSSTTTLARSNGTRYLRLRDADLRYGNPTHGVWFDNQSFLFTHTLSNSIEFQMKDYNWYMSNQVFGEYKLRSTFYFATTGVDVYNPVTGAALAIGASAFVTKSARSTKTDIDALPFDSERVIANAPASMWEYRDEQRDEHGKYRKARKRFGPMADDLPAALQVSTGRDPSVMGVDLASQIAVVWAATSQQTARLDDLTARLVALEGAA